MVFQLVLHIILILWLSKESALAASLAKLGCSETCGNVTIPYPFGIGPNCYLNEWFEITCKNSSKPFISSIDLEVLEVLLEGFVRVNIPVISSNCSNGETGLGVVNLTGSPFFFSSAGNIFMAMGCNNLAKIINQTGTAVGGCMSICEGNTEETGLCQTTIPSSLNFFNASLEGLNSKSDGRECKHAFMVDYYWYFYNVTDIYAMQNMEYVPAVLVWRKYMTCTSDSNSTCGLNAYCSNQTPTPLCFCSPGFQGNPHLPKPQGCPDKCEGDSNGNRCGRSCSSTPWGYRCDIEDPVNKSRVKVIILGMTHSFLFFLV